MIEVDGLSVRYPRAARPALDGVSFTARAGALTAVVGPNGSGMPEPFGPTTAVSAPARAVNETPSSAGRAARG